MFELIWTAKKQVIKRSFHQMWMFKSTLTEVNVRVKAILNSNGGFFGPQNQFLINIQADSFDFTEIKLPLRSQF